MVLDTLEKLPHDALGRLDVATRLTRMLEGGRNREKKQAAGLLARLALASTPTSK